MVNMMSKVMSLRDAVTKFVPEGSWLFIGAAHEALIPFAVVYELIRQKTSHLTVCAPISDMACDVLVGAGLVDAVRAAWVGNVSAGLGHNIRRSQEEGVPHSVTFYDYSNYTMALALQASQMGVPFLPTRALQGTDLMKSRVGFESFGWHGESLVAVPALQPDVAIIGVQRADPEGNGMIDGPRGMTHEVAMASRHVILVCEELLTAEADKSLVPWHVQIPSLVVDAVVPVSMAFHPSPCFGYYGRDTAFFRDYHEKTRAPDGFHQWLNRWIGESHEDYRARLGTKRLEILHRHEKEGLIRWP